MTTRQQILAILHYEDYDRLPLLHFGFLDRTLRRWQEEGHLTADEVSAALQGDGSPGDNALAAKLGFDANYHSIFSPNQRLRPGFQSRVLREFPNGDRHVLTGLGQIILTNDTNQSIPAHIGHTLRDRKSWDEEFKFRLEFHPDRVEHARVNVNGEWRRFDQGGKEYLANPDRETHILLHCGSLIGHLRDYIGVENLAYLSVDDPELLTEIIDTNAELSYQCAKAALESGATFDIGHFWEDICFKTGPLVTPTLMRDQVGPHYARIAKLMADHGIDLVSLDSDGCIDQLVPIWLENGVNVMFPIEVGTWRASFTPWREQYGQAIRGVGGLDKRVFQKDRAAVDAEIERLKPIIELGGYIPCPDHRLPHDNNWDSVRYYCDRMQQIFG